VLNVVKIAHGVREDKMQDHEMFTVIDIQEFTVMLHKADKYWLKWMETRIIAEQQRRKDLLVAAQHKNQMKLEE